MVAGVVSGCGGSRATGVAGENAAIHHGAALRGDSATPPPEYRIGLLDELEIRVKYHDRLNEAAKVRPDGRITLQDVGELYVAGMTPSELDRALTAAYAREIHDPEVTVYVRNFAGLAIYVLGEVEKPGMVEMRPNMTALQAVAAASGPVRGAKLNSVVVLRRDTTGALTATRLDLSRARVAEAQAQDMLLQPEDIVFVPRTFIADVNEFLGQIYDGLFPPFDIYLRTLREYNRR